MKRRMFLVLAHEHEARNLGLAAQAVGAFGADGLILVDCPIKINQTALICAGSSKQVVIQSRPYNNWTEFWKSEPKGDAVLISSTQGQAAHKDFASVPGNDLKPLYIISTPQHQQNRVIAEANILDTWWPSYLSVTDENLNLAAALALYQVRTLTVQPTPAKMAAFPESAVKEWLNALQMNQAEGDNKAYELIKGLIVDRSFSERELRLLEAVIQQTVRKLTATHPSS